jgi:hypothetical protein
MKTKYLQPAELIIPLSLLAFVGPGINYVNIVFNGSTRWALLASLSVFLLLTRMREMFVLMRSPIFWMVVIHAFWGLLTVLWSEEPLLSFVKALGFFWLATTMMIAGNSWVIRHSRAQTYDFFWLFVLFSLLSIAGGQVVENDNMNFSLYQGLTGNPNFLGFILSISSAWLIWYVYLMFRLNNFRLCFLFFLLLTVNTYYLLLAHSRSSLLLFLTILLGFIIGWGKFKKILLYSLIPGIFFMTAYNSFPSVKKDIKQYAFKTNLDYLEEVEVENAILWSRESLWQESYELALSGGLLGGGYGVTIGEKFYGEIGSTISTGKYGREQGNSQFAIIEQSGLIGFVIYLTLIASIGWSLVSGFSRSLVEEDRVAIGLMGGMIFGMLILSIFEAWWVAPGSVESASFWMLIGALVGSVKRARKNDSHL